MGKGTRCTRYTTFHGQNHDLYLKYDLSPSLFSSFSSFPSFSPSSPPPPSASPSFPCRCVTAYRSTSSAGYDPCGTEYPTCSISGGKDPFEGPCKVRVAGCPRLSPVVSQGVSYRLSFVSFA